MGAMLVRERYKVVWVLDAREDYAFAEAVDILDREKGACLLNIYEGPLLRAYLPCFDQMQNCPAFRGMFLDGESLVTVFDTCGGEPIDRVFYRGDHHDWRTRLDYAERLLHQALSMADLPPEVSCAAMLSENVRIDLKGDTLALRFQVVPLEGMNPRELVYLTCDQLRKILLPREGVEDLGARKVVWSDLDGNGHVYSGNYGDFVWDYLPADLQEKVPREFFINYSKEATLGQELRMVGCRKGGEYLMEGLGPEGVCFSAQCVF